MAAAPTFYVVPGSTVKSIIDDNINAAIELVEDLERQGMSPNSAHQVISR